MTTPVIYPDLELVVTGYLRTALADYGYPAMFVSNTRGTQTTAVWVRRDGGSALNIIREQPRITTNVFAPTEQTATDLARTVAALMRAMPRQYATDVVEVSGPSPVVDSTPRRFMIHELIVRGSELAPTP